MSTFEVVEIHKRFSYNNVVYVKLNEAEAYIESSGGIYEIEASAEVIYPLEEVE